MLLFGTLHLAEHTFPFLPCFSLLSLVICKASSASPFAFLLYFYFGMVLFAASCTIIQTSVHSSGTLFTRFNPLNLCITSTAYLHVMLAGSSQVVVEGSSRGARLCPLWLEFACLHGGGPLCFWCYGFLTSIHGIAAL